MFELKVLDVMLGSVKHFFAIFHVIFLEVRNTKKKTHHHQKSEKPRGAMSDNKTTMMLLVKRMHLTKRRITDRSTL
jgi:hypothetical protein